MQTARPVAAAWRLLVRMVRARRWEACSRYDRHQAVISHLQHSTHVSAPPTLTRSQRSRSSIAPPDIPAPARWTSTSALGSALGENSPASSALTGRAGAGGRRQRAMPRALALAGGRGTWAKVCVLRAARRAAPAAASVTSPRTKPMPSSRPSGGGGARSRARTATPRRASQRPSSSPTCPAPPVIAQQSPRPASATCGSPSPKSSSAIPDRASAVLSTWQLSAGEQLGDTWRERSEGIASRRALTSDARRTRER